MKTRKYKRPLCWLLKHVDVRCRAEDRVLPAHIEARMRNANDVAETLALVGSDFVREARYIWVCQRCGRVNEVGIELWFRSPKKGEALVQSYVPIERKEKSE